MLMHFYTNGHVIGGVYADGSHVCACAGSNVWHTTFKHPPDKCKITAVIFSVILIVSVIQDTLKSDVDSAMFCKTGLVSEDTNIEDFTEVMTTNTKRLWGYIWMHPDQPTTLRIHPDAYPDQPNTHNNNL